MDELQAARYVSLTTFTRDGHPKATPVWITGSSGSYGFVTNTDSWKARRLRNDPTVELRACDIRGKVDPHASVHHGTGEVLDDAAALQSAEQALLAKYGWQARLIGLTDSLRKLVGKASPSSAIRLEITRDERDS